MGGNVHATTIHSLAFRYLKRYELLKGELVSDKRVLLSIIADRFKMETEDYAFLKLVLDSFEVFCNSSVSISEFDEISLSKIVAENRELLKRFRSFANGKHLFSEVAEFVSIIYKLMMEGDIPFTHSFYLKYFSELVDEKSYRWYDCVLLDEAQDVNPVQIKIIEKMSPGQFILVGDRHQSIYGWRGAVNSMERFDFPTEHLTHSFRFRTDLPAVLANGLLGLWKGEEKKLVVASSKKKSDTVAWIFRTNLNLILDLAEKDCVFRTVRPLRELFGELFVADKIVKFFDTRKWELLDGVPYYLKNLIRRARSSSYFKYLLYEVDSDLLRAIEAVEDVDVQELYEELRRRQRKEEGDFYLTAHTSKGLEFGRVIVADDFPSVTNLIFDYVRFLVEKENLLIKKDRIRKELSILERGGDELLTELVQSIRNRNEEVKFISDEVNLAYVAVTRAIEELHFEGEENNPIIGFLNPFKMQEYYTKAIEKRMYVLRNQLEMAKV
jgi:superfamily I DNA/RNA helicase